MQQTDELLGPYVRGEATLDSEAEARKLVGRVMDLTNFCNWRGRRIVAGTIMEEEGAWPAFATLVLGGLRQTRGGTWQPELEEVLAWLGSRRSPANLSKLLPAYFLFLYDPEHHFAMKPWYWDRFLDGVGAAKLGHGVPLSVERYEGALAVCQELRDGPLAEWKPRDNVDVHSFAWVVGGGWADVGEGAAETTGEASEARGLMTAAASAGAAQSGIDLNLILAGPPGTGKTFRLLQLFRPAFMEGDVRRYEFVTFHQSYAYEDFVEGIRPAPAGDGSGAVVYRVRDGIFEHLVARGVADPEHAYALFVDETNRANVSNVLGELITLIEPDKRMRFDRKKGEWVGGVRLRLPYTHAADPDAPLFGIADNLHFIGTMNTADRSIVLLDLALRRRFRFDELMPEPAILAVTPGPVAAGDGGVIHLDRMLDNLNERIEYLLDRDHAIGHAYLGRVSDVADLDHVFRQELVPLLQEHFYGEWAKIQFVLADLIDEQDRDGRPRQHPDAIVTHVILQPADLLGVSDDAYQSRRSHSVNEELTARSFRKIYETA